VIKGGKIESSANNNRGDIENLLSFFHSSPDLLFVFDSDGNILETNNTVTEKLKFTTQELKGKLIFTLHSPDDWENARKYLAEILAGERSYCPLPLMTKDGELLYAETKISKGTWNGKDAIFSISKDVSEKKHAEETARKIEERYHVLFSNINDVVFVHEFTESGLPGKFFEVNQKACERLGYSKEEFLTMTPKDIDAPEGYALVPEMMKKLEKDKHVVWEGVHVTKNGANIPVEISNHLFEMEGRPVILATVRDITERKKSEELLKKSEEKYRKIFENIQDVFYQSDLTGRIIEISPSIERYSGYKPEELIGMKIEDVYLNPGDRAEMLRILSVKGEIEDFIIKLKAKDNREVLVSANIHLLYDQGKPVALEGSLRDVTERIIAQEKIKESENLLRKQNEEYVALNNELKQRNEQILMINKDLQQASDIFMNIRTGLHIYHLEDIEDDRTLRMIAVNPAAERLTGISSGDVIGKTLDENFPGLREKGIPQDYANVVRTKISKQFEEVTYSDNRLVEGAFTFNAFPLPEDCVGISFENITEQIKARESIIESNKQLKIAKEKAEESDKLKSSFLANMSHEIRTPMNGIIGFSMMLSDPTLPEETRESYVKIVNSSCDQLLHIINDVIDISKIETGQTDLFESSFSLYDLFDELISFYSPTANEQGVILSIKVSEDTHPLNGGIIADRTKLRQVLDNLLSNAVKFTHSGEIVLRWHISDDEFIYFEIQDTGIGIPDNYKDIIFERFRQVDTSFSKNYGGTGLGLSISKAYIEKMGGKISVSSELGKGSKFTFTIPYKVSNEVHLPSNGNDNNLKIKENIKILVVEDEEINWFYLYEILRKSTKPINAVSGAQAIDLLKTNPDIEIVLMDIKLPDINGLELTKIIKSMRPEINVIAQTAFALSGDREKALEAGCSEYISKPVKKEALLDLIANFSAGTK
jgi:PAS domain S-box-containing protein